MTHYLTIGRWRMPIVVVAIALAMMTLTIELGRWQTRRAQEKIALQDHLSAARERSCPANRWQRS